MCHTQSAPSHALFTSSGFVRFPCVAAGVVGSCQERTSLSDHVVYGKYRRISANGTPKHIQQARAGVKQRFATGVRRGDQPLALAFEKAARGRKRPGREPFPGIFYVRCTTRLDGLNLKSGGALQLDMRHSLVVRSGKGSKSQVEDASHLLVVNSWVLHGVRGLWRNVEGNYARSSLFGKHLHQSPAGQAGASCHDAVCTLHRHGRCYVCVKCWSRDEREKDGQTQKMRGGAA